MVIDDAMSRIAGVGAFPCGGTPKLSEGERRRAAVLFLDLTGFTLLSESMDHEELHVLLGRIMGLLSTVVVPYGGYVDKFEGDRLMALFGAVTATGNDSVRAVGCALRMLELLEDLRGALGGSTAVSARIGIDFGPLTVAPDPSGHMTATGHTVNIASRLEEAAQTGSALVSGSVRRECGDLYTWHEVGSIPVRGTGSVIDAFRPLGPGSLRMQRWQRAARLAGSPFVGRKGITDSIGSALQASSAKGSEPAVFMICAEAGIGKSRLAHHCVNAPAGFRVLHGKALSHAQPSCWLWISLLRDFLDADGNTDRSREWYAAGIRALSGKCPVARTRAALDNLADSLSEILSLDAVGLKGGASANPQTVMNAMRPALEAVFSLGNTLLLLEDLHWADEVSLSVLRGVLSQGMMVQPSGIIMTTRPPVPDLGAPQYAPRTIELPPLSDPDCLEIAAHILSLPPRKPLQPDLALLIRRVARGNPFVVEELVLSLIESGGLQEVGPGVWEQTVPCDRVPIPSSISVLTQARMDRLPGDERRTLQYASVLGELFSRELLEAVLKDLSLDVENLGLTIAGLVEKGFLSETGPMGLGFRHALVRMAAYETLLKHNSRLLHRTAALAMERLYPSELDALSTVILSHWDGACDTENALKWALRAMRIARDGGRPEEATKLSDRLLEIAGDSDDDRMWQARMQALLVRQEIVERGGAHEEALGIIDRMICEADIRKSPFWLAGSLRAKAKVLQELGRNTEFEQTIRDALAAAEASGDEIITAKVKMTLANHRSSVGLSKSAMALYGEAAATLENHGMGTEAASLLSNMAVHAFRQGDDRLSERYAEMAVQTHARHGNLQGLGYSLNSLAIACARKEEFDRAGELFLEALDAARKTGDRVHECTVLGNLGLLATKRGDMNGAMEYTNDSIELAATSRNYRTTATSLVNRARIQWLSGDCEGACASARESLKVNELAGDVLNTAYAKGVLGLVLLDNGSTEDALRVCEELRQHVDEHSIRKEMLEDYCRLLDDLEGRGFDVARPGFWADKVP